MFLRFSLSGALATVTDSETGRTTTYYYDFIGRNMKYVESGTGYSHSVGYEYDEKNMLTAMVETINGTEKTTSYTYDDDDRITSVTDGTATKNYTYDAFGRAFTQTTKHENSTVKTDTYNFDPKDSSTVSTYQLQSHKVEYADNTEVSYQYAYDANGNITSISDGTKTTTYEYDAANQLVRENNQAKGFTQTWEYDNAGNIELTTRYAYTTTGDLTNNTVVSSIDYRYQDNAGWGDLLTSYVTGGKTYTVSYDSMGNPTTVTDTSDNTKVKEFSWKYGRQLATFTKGGVEWTYTYDANGMRTSRSGNGKTYNYVYNGDQLTQMTIVTAGVTETVGITYDANGSPFALTYDGPVDEKDGTYYYITNIQGDVIGITDSAGTLILSYFYDAYGKAAYTYTNKDLAATLTGINPLTYRSYVMDTGTGLYYLQSRYYDPELGRFINADNYPSTGQGLLGNNMFAYCNNNPVIHKDSEGTALETVLDIISLASSIVDVAQNPNDPWAWIGLAGDIIDVAVPFVGGVGETVRVINTARKTADAIDDVHDAARMLDTAADLTQDLSKVDNYIPEALCFIAGTLIKGEEGNIPIEEVEAGDMVWAWDEETGDVALKEVVETYINETDELIHVHVNGEEIITTPSHPFYSPVKGWTSAVHLRAGDILVLVNGEYVVVEKVQHEILEAPILVYNFQVEDYHTYYVSSVGVLVHNSCKHQSSEWKTKRSNYWKDQAAKGGNSTWYDPNTNNLNLMRQGKAPWGWDGEKVVLHHVKGIANSMDDFVEIGAKAHRAFHQAYGYKDFIDIFLV